MWKNFELFLKSDTTLEYNTAQKNSSEALEIAVLALLLKVGLVDLELASIELEKAVAFISREFDDSLEHVGSLVETAEFLSKDPSKLNTLIDHIAKDLTKGQKQEVLKGIWSVLKADGFVDRAESTNAAEIRKLLGLTLEEAMFAQVSSEEENTVAMTTDSEE